MIDDLAIGSSTNNTMSHPRILGMAGSTAQIAQLSIDIVTSLISLFQSIRDAPVTIQARLAQVQTLIEILTLIQSQPQLQTSEIDNILRTCVREGEELRDLLEGFLIHTNGSRIRRWANAIGGLAMEERIIDQLQRLERGKTSLTLCIAQIDSYVVECQKSRG